MKKRERKGFTIVELVIVIAIISVLAAVLVPTFSSLIDKANQSADIQAARQLNNALAQGSIPNRPTDIGGVRTILGNAGFNEEELRPITKNYKFFWYGEENIIILVELPEFLDDAITLTEINLPLEYHAKVWYPDDRENEGSIAYDFENKLNELIGILWDSEYVDKNGNLIIQDGQDKEVLKGQIKSFLESKSLSDGLYPIYITIFEHDLASESGSSYVPINGISLNCTTLSIGVGQTERLTATITPANAKQDVSWTTDQDEIATVDEDGYVTAVSQGTAVITATSKVNKNFKATCTVTVAAVQAEDFEILDSEVVLKKGASIDALAVEFTPDNTTNKTVTWYSDNSEVATVDQNTGKITAISVGKTTITATPAEGGEPDSCEVFVVDLSLSQTQLDIVFGAEATLTTSGIPDDAPVVVEWTSSSAVVTVSGGKITTNNTGTATITATVKYNDMGICSATCEVTVKSAVNGDITVTPVDDENNAAIKNYVLYVNETGTLQANFNTLEGGSASVKWESTALGVLTVNETTGEVTAIAPGEAVIIATVTDGSNAFGQCKITVIEDIKDLFKFSQENVTLIAGKQQTYALSISSEHPSIKSVEWISTFPKYATVDGETGEVSAITAGETFIQAKVTDKNGSIHLATLTLKVESAINGDITFASSTVNLVINKEDQKTTQQRPKYTLKEGISTAPGFTWSVDDEGKSVVEIAEDGTVTAKANGTAIITVTSQDDSKKTAFYTVNVTTAVESVSVTPSEIILVEGESMKLETTVTPSDASNKKVNWSVTSGDQYVTVDTEGNVKAVAAGTAIITATTEDGTKTAECEVTVEAAKIEVTKIELPETLNLAIGCVNSECSDCNIATLTATVDPAGATVEWNSDNEGIATVDQSGKVTAVAPGTTTITATCGDKIAECTVTVCGAKFDQSEYVFEKIVTKQTEFLMLTLNYVMPNEGKDKCFLFDYDQTVIREHWGRDNNEYSEYSLMYQPLKAGETTITATLTITVGGQEHKFTDQCLVTVNNPATKIELNPSSMNLVVGQKYTLEKTLTPSDSNSEVKWESSKNTVASVENNGSVTAVGRGSATIKASVSESVFAECQMKVYEVQFSDVKGNLVSRMFELTDNYGQMVKIAVLDEKGECTIIKVAMSSDNTAVVECDESTIGGVCYYILKPKGAGVATVTFTITLDNGTILTAPLMVYRENNFLNALLNGSEETYQMEADQSLSNINIDVQNNLTINNDKHTLTLTAPTYDSCIDVRNGATLTIDGGTLVIEGASGFGGIFIAPAEGGTPAGKLILKNVKIVHTSGICFLNYGTLEITGCTIESAYSEVIRNGTVRDENPIVAMLKISGTTIDVDAATSSWPVIWNHRGSKVEFGTGVKIAGTIKSKYYGGAFENEDGGIVRGTFTDELQYVNVNN